MENESKGWIVKKIPFSKNDAARLINSNRLKEEKYLLLIGIHFLTLETYLTRAEIAQNLGISESQTKNLLQYLSIIYLSLDIKPNYYLNKEEADELIEWLDALRENSENSVKRSSKLSDAETDILRLKLIGMKSSDIAASRGVHPDTLKPQVRSIFGKIGLLTNCADIYDKGSMHRTILLIQGYKESKKKKKTNSGVF